MSDPESLRQLLAQKLPPRVEQLPPCIEVLEPESQVLAAQLYSRLPPSRPFPQIDLNALAYQARLAWLRAFLSRGGHRLGSQQSAGLARPPR